MGGLFLTLTLAICAIVGMPAAAAVTSVSASPDPIVVNAQGSVLATVRWTVGVTLSAPATLSSPVGTVSGGPSSETPGRLLRKNVTTLGASTHRFSERVRISRASVRALRSGATVTYARSWDDGGAPSIAVIAMALGSGGELVIQNASLKFGNDSRYAIIGKGEALRAYATITSSGRGRFDGVWQISGPAGVGPGAFVPIDRVRRVLAGPRSTVFESPVLPTDRPGLYQVRLLPGPDASDVTASLIPTIRYLVKPVSGLSEIGLGTPAAGAAITNGTQFSWDGLRGASVYRLEFISDGSVGAGDRIAAIDVAAPDTSTSIRKFTIDRMTRGGARYWRVVALDSSGSPIGSSSIRRIGGGVAGGRSN